MYPFRIAARFNGTGFQRWKVLIEAHLQATGLNVWRVVSEGTKSNSQPERQYDATAKNIILLSLNENVFNRAYSCENAHKLWKTIIENHEDSENVANERYHVLIDRFNSFKQLNDENAESMYSRLNTLVNEINSLGVKQIDDTELICKIFHSLRRPDYDLVITVLYEKKINTLTPNQVLSKVIAHELRHDIKSRAPPPSPTHSALACKQVKKLKEMAIKGSSSEEEEEEECQNSSNDEKEPMDPNLYKKVKKMKNT